MVGYEKEELEPMHNMDPKIKDRFKFTIDFVKNLYKDAIPLKRTYNKLIKEKQKLKTEISNIFNENYLSRKDLYEELINLLKIDYDDFDTEIEEYNKKYLFFEEFQKAYMKDDQKKIYEICSREKPLIWEVIGMGTGIAYAGVLNLPHSEDGKGWVDRDKSGPRRISPKEMAERLKDIMSKGYKPSERTLNPQMYGIYRLDNVYFYPNIHSDYGKSVVAFDCNDYCAFKGNDGWAILTRNRIPLNKIIKLFILNPNNRNCDKFDQDYQKELIFFLKRLNVPFEIKDFD
jgi:hypothetical protein